MWFSLNLILINSELQPFKCYNFIRNESREVTNSYVSFPGFIGRDLMSHEAKIQS